MSRIGPCAVRRVARMGIRLANRSGFAVFPLTRGRGGHPMGVQQSRARPRTNEVNAHPGNPGLTLRRISCATSGEGGSAAG